MLFRNPAYTGANRCWPCTVVNVALVAGVAGGVALAGYEVAAAAAAAAGLAAVGLRGYVVPGTPRLTAHLPAAVLAWFGKAPGSDPPAVARGAREAGLLARDTDEVLLADGVRAEYERRARDLAGDRERLVEAVVETFEDVEEVSVNRSLGGGENWFARDADGNLVLQWEARGVAAMDVAGEELLADGVPGVTGADRSRRRRARALLRRGARTCPECGTDLEPESGSTVVCCGGRSLVGALRCPACSYAVVDANDLPGSEPAAAGDGRTR
jgi:hypothetical protein